MAWKQWKYRSATVLNIRYKQSWNSTIRDKLRTQITWLWHIGTVRQLIPESVKTDGLSTHSESGEERRISIVTH